MDSQKDGIVCWLDAYGTKGRMMKQGLGKSVLLLSNGFTVFIGSMLDAKMHAHHAIQITIGVSDYLKITIEQREIEAGSVIVSKNIEHRLCVTDSKVVLILIEPESEIGRQISLFVKESYQIFRYDFFGLDLPGDPEKWNNLSVDLFKRRVITALNLAEYKKKYDERVNTIMRYIKNTKYTGCIKSLAEKVNLSESRLEHLFKGQEGVSLKYYLLWQKISLGVHYATMHHDLTKAAYDAGFSDSAHMSRTFRKMFGICLRSIFKNSRFVQVYIQ